MAEKHDRQPRKVGRDAAIEAPEIAEAFRPALALSEKTEIGWRGRLAMAAMIVGVNAVSLGRQRLGQPRIAPGVFGQPMRDLYDRMRFAIRQPSIDMDLRAVV